MDTYSLSTYLWEKKADRNKQPDWLYKSKTLSPPAQPKVMMVTFILCIETVKGLAQQWGVTEVLTDWQVIAHTHTHTQTLLYWLVIPPPLLPPSPHTLFPLTMLHRHIHTLSFPLTMFHLQKWLTSHPHALLPSALPSVLSTDIHRQVTHSHIFSHHLSLCFIHNY